MRRRTASIVGSLFIIATTAGILSVVLLGPQEALRSADLVREHERGLTLGAIAVLIMAAAIAMIAPTIFPVLREHGEGAALGYVVSRSLEVVLLLPAAIGPLVLLAVSNARTGTPDDAIHFGTVQVLTQTYNTWGHPVSAVFFCLSVVLLNALLYRSRLVPRLISVWALAAVLPYLADGFMVMFGVVTLSSPVHTAMIAPLALNELVLAIWLLTRGFRSVPRTSPSGLEAQPRERTEV